MDCAGSVSSTRTHDTRSKIARRTIVNFNNWPDEDDMTAAVDDWLDKMIDDIAGVG